MTTLTVRFYPSGAGGPVKEYLDQLNKSGQRRKAMVRIIQDIQTLASEGLRSQQISVRFLGPQLWELRRLYQGIRYRIIFGLKESEIWLLHAFEKKTDKTPANELHLAQMRWRNLGTKK